MRPLKADELLQVWEEGAGLPLLEKSLLLLGKSCAVDDWKQLVELSIGDRDARLLQLREWIFGNKMHNMAACPACGETIEWETNTQDLLLQPIQQQVTVSAFSLSHGGFNIRYRLPNSFDVSKSAAEENADATINNLLTGCILDITGTGNETYPPDALPPDAWQALEESMSEQDPQADMNMQIVCPYCRHSWEAAFDIMSFLWAEINNWAKHMLHEVALLAHAFSWSEKDILAMTPRRRQLYIEMLYQ